MKTSWLICGLILALLAIATQAEDYQSKAGPWTLVFSSSKNFTIEVSSDEKTDYNLWLVILTEANGKGSASFSLFSYNEPKSVDIYLNALFDAYIKINNVTTPTKGPIFIAGEQGVQAEGFSVKSSSHWHGAAWPYAPYRDPNSGTNNTYDIVILESNLPDSEFQEMTQSLSLSKGYWFNPRPWIIEFNCSQKLIPKTEFLSGGYLLNLYDQEDHLVAWISMYSFGTLAQANNQFLDKMLDTEIANYQVTSPTKKSITVDRTQGRIAEGYSSFYGRKWRGIVYPVGSKYDPFTSTNSTKYFIGFDSLQDTDQFEEIADSIHAINQVDNTEASESTR
jgi:hypothetical protein